MNQRLEEAPRENEKQSEIERDWVEKCKEANIVSEQRDTTLTKYSLRSSNL